MFSLCELLNIRNLLYHRCSIVQRYGPALFDIERCALPPLTHPWMYLITLYRLISQMQMRSQSVPSAPSSFHSILHHQKNNAASTSGTHVSGPSYSAVDPHLNMPEVPRPAKKPKLAKTQSSSAASSNPAASDGRMFPALPHASARLFVSDDTKNYKEKYTALKKRVHQVVWVLLLASRF